MSTATAIYPRAEHHTGDFGSDGKLTAEAQARRCGQAAATVKEFLLNAPQRLDLERLTHLLDVYEEYAHEPTIILRARVFERLLQKKALFLDENPLVGSVTGSPAGVYVYPEYGTEWVLEELEQPILSHLGEVSISEEGKALLLKAASFFKHRNAEAKARQLSEHLLGYNPKDSVKAGLITETAPYTIGSGTVDYEDFVKRGIKALINEVEERLHALPRTVASSGKIDFYRAVLISLNALVSLANRYADLAEAEAKQTRDPARKAELLDIAAVCRHVPENPPRTFREALQSWWFIHLGVQIEQSGCGSSPGRIGQYLEPFYQKDKTASGLTPDQAKEWLKCLFVKILEYGYYQGQIIAKTNSGHTGHTINLGGLNADGQDATGELDYLLLDTQIAMQTIQPTLTILYHDGLPEDFLLKAVELERTGLGQPQWMNNRVIMERLFVRHGRNGITLEDARNCINMSCVGTGVAGKTVFLHENGSFNLAKCLELALHNGVDPLTGAAIGAATGDPGQFTSFERVYEAYDKQVEHLFATIRPFGSLSSKALGDVAPPPFRSALYRECRERGKNIFEGGAKYYLYFVISSAGIDVVNSLAAIKQLVFDEQKFTLQEMIQALDANFEGYEDIRALCLKAPKHGNADLGTDVLARKVYDDSMTNFRKSEEEYFEGHIANIEAYSLSIHNYFGQLTGALPSGRLALTPLTDGSVSATPGTDVKGPLALVSSAARAIDTVKYGSNHFNMKFHPSALSGVAGARKLLSLIKSYMDQGGSHIQFNVVSSDTLKKAQANPEQYKGLTVRVAGFSAYFTRLHRGVQDEIINRTELNLQ